jgi:NADPH-dependent 2,4-dienoyl-CoA reductase/sulfur reductase-like enzyme
MSLSELVATFIEKQGIRNLFGKQIERINGADHLESVIIAGETILCDLVVMATGIEPTSKLATEAGIITEKGFIVADKQMRTNDPDIYTVGDASLTFSNIDGKPINVALATTAYRHASIAGVNAAGGNATYDGAIGTFVTYFGGLEVSCAGYNTLTANAHGFKTISGRANMKTKPHWMPDTEDISVKIIAETETGRILGGQAIGTSGTDWRINMIALAIKKKMTIHEFSTIELAYCPAVSDLYDPLIVAIDATLRRLESIQKTR